MNPRNPNQSQMKYVISSAAVFGILVLALLTGCKGKDEQALDQAKSQAISTNTPQQVQFINNKGNLVTETVQPPATAGAQPLVTTTVQPPPAGPVPAETNPVITPLGGGAFTSSNAAMSSDNGGSGAMTSSNNGAPVAPPAAPGPFSLTVPAGTNLAIRVNQHISVKTSRAGDRFSGEIVEPITKNNGAVIIPRGTPVSGRIDASHKRGHFKGASILELRLTSMTLNGTEYPISTHDNVRTKKGKGRRTGGFIGGMTAAGMIIGGVASGGLGVAVGGAAGAGAGTLIAGTTGNRDISIPAESIVHFRLSDDLIVQAQ
jgi:hypothetical protein